MSELVSPIKVGPAKDVLLLHDGSPFAKTVARLLALDYRLGAFLETVWNARGRVRMFAAHEAGIPRNPRFVEGVRQLDLRA